MDADFGEAPMMLSTQVNRSKRDIVVAVFRKVGLHGPYIDRDNGSLVWPTVSLTLVSYYQTVQFYLACCKL